MEQNWRFCQCCCKNSSDADSRSLADQEYHQVSYASMMDTCFDILAENAEDVKYLFICFECIEKMKSCYEFRNQIVETQKKLTRINSLSAKVTIIPDAEYKSLCDTSKTKETNNMVLETLDNNQCDLSGLDDPDGGSYLLVVPEVSEKPKKVTKKRVVPAYKKNAKVDSPSRKAKRDNTDENTDHTCEFCNVIFETLELLIGHKKLEHQSSLTCQHCFRIFESRRILKKHEDIHVKVHCDFCDQDVTKAYLRKHQQIHLVDYPYTCRVCKLRFRSDLQQRKHRAAVHGIPLKKYKCDQCPKSYNTASARYAHMHMVHEKKRDHICQVCDKGFFSKSLLTYHMMTHTGDKPFECTVCDKRFPKKYALGEHLKVHYDIRNHACHICGKTFVQAYSLRNHLKGHEKETNKSVS